MCGIAGLIYLDGRPVSRDHDESILQQMGNAIRHRGPDDTRTMLWGNVGFVFKRLSIVDLDGGRQPFHTEDGRISAMVNGEIYNHQEIRTKLASRFPLTTRSDCEVIPYLYLDRDKNLFDPVNGMFAVALLDRERKRVLLARDRLGIRPLFYCIADNGKVLVFASELKGLFAHPAVPRRFDWVNALARPWSGRETRSRELASCFLGVHRVPAGHILDLNLNTGAHDVTPYWRLPRDRANNSVEPVDYYVERYRELLEQSVSYRLMADVGYGIFLSGGIDSASIAAIVAKKKQCPTFSVFSQSTLGNGDAESAYRTANQLGLPNHQVFFDHRSIKVTPDDWRRILWSCELFDITAEQLFKYYLHQFAKQRYPNLKVILLGQGSDEFTCGYMDRTIGREGPWTKENWKDLADALRRKDASRAAAELGLAGQYTDLIRHGIFDRSFICEAAGRNTDRETWDLYTDTFRQNLDYHLWHEDRTASAHAIESRVPFLDHQLLTFLASIPVQRHAELFTNKQILRSAVAGLLPESIYARPKGYFFYGKDERYTYQMMYSIITANGGELIDQALSGSDRTDGPLMADGLRKMADSIGGDPAYADLTRLLFVVNMGVLADLAMARYEPPAFERSLPVRELTPEEFESMAANAPLEDNNADLNDAIVAFPQGFSLVQARQGNNASLMPGNWYIAKYGQIFYHVKSQKLVEFLLHIDGHKTLSQIVNESGLDLSAVRKHVSNAVAKKFLVAKSPE